MVAVCSREGGGALRSLLAPLRLLREQMEKSCAAGTGAEGNSKKRQRWQDAVTRIGGWPAAAAVDAAGANDLWLMWGESVVAAAGSNPAPAKKPKTERK